MLGLIAGLGLVFASVLGSVIGLFLQKISHRTNDAILGFAAGVMSASAFIGLLPTAFYEDQTIFQSLLAALSLLLGAMTISVLDRFVPHMHFHDGVIHESESEKLAEHKHSKKLLLILAIMIHNIPEGLATGIVFNDGVTKNAIMVASSMIIQKIPEGLIVVLPLLALNLSKTKAFLYSIVVALMVLPGTFFGIIFGALPDTLNSIFYAFTFGAITYVVSDEIIPESHEHGFQKAATFALIVGILVVVLMQKIG